MHADGLIRVTYSSSARVSLAVHAPITEPSLPTRRLTCPFKLYSSSLINHRLAREGEEGGGGVRREFKGRKYSF